MARCPACGSPLSSDRKACHYCRATFQAVSPDEPIDDRSVVRDLPFGSKHRKQAGVLACIVAGALFGSAAWWLSTGLLGQDTSERQWISLLILLILPMNAIRAFLRVRTGRPAAFFSPSISFHTKIPIEERTVTLNYYAAISIVVLVPAHFTLLG